MTRSIDPFLSLNQGRTMNAIEAIKETYSPEDFKEIANHGCQSGVCSQHIYYGDTIKFFDTYEEDIFDHIVCNYGTEFLVEMFKKADASLTHYKNDVVWCFIEMIAFEVADAMEIYHEECTVQPSDTHMYKTEDGELVYRNA